MSAHRTTARRGRRIHRGCSQAVLLLALASAGSAWADARSTDPEAPILTNRYAGSAARTGGPGLDAATSGPPMGVSAETGVVRELPPPMGADTALTAEAPAQPPPEVGRRTLAALAPTAFAPAGLVPASPPPSRPSPPPAVPAPVTTPVEPPRSSPAAQAGPAGTPRVFTAIDLPLSLNGRFLGMISADVDVSGAGLVDSQRFLSLITPAVAPATLVAIRQAVAGRERTPFADLDIPGFRLEFSTSSLELKAIAGGDSLAATRMALSGNIVPPDPADFPQPARFSAGANIAIAERYIHGGDGGTTPLRGVIDGLVHWGGFDGVTLVTGADYDGSREGEEWRRRETRLVKDDFNRAIRTTLGEFTPLAAGFQGSGRIVGVGVERAYSTVRPFQNVRPTGRQEFTLDREANVDVIINGLTTQTLRLAPGRYSVSDFPFATGANQVQLVVDDVSGRNEIAVFDVFSGSDLLGAGVIDFGLGVGRYEGSGAFEYDGPVLATGYVRKGLNDSLTLGLNGQASQDSQQVGVEGVWGSRFGLLLLELAASRDALLDRTGAAASVSYRHTFSLRERDDLRITATAETTSEFFQDPFQPGRPNLEIWRASALVQWNAPWELGLSLGVGVSEGRLEGTNRRQLDLGVSRSFGRASLVSSVSFTDGPDDNEDDVRFSIGLTVPLGGRWTSQARYDSGENRAEAIISRYSTGGLGDISGEARLTNDDRNRLVSGQVDYINNRFEAQLSHNRRYDQIEEGRSDIETNLAVSTFIGYAGGSFGIGRPTDDAFIIAPVHRSLAGSDVTIMSGSQKVARSGLFGPPVVPIRRAYGVNNYDVVIEPLPPGYDIGSGTLNVFPSFGSGYRMQIGSDASRIAVGSLVGPDGPLQLATGLIAGPGDSGAEPRPFFTNRAGRFVADRLAPGDYRVLMDDVEVARFTIPESSEGVVNVGVLQISKP